VDANVVEMAAKRVELKSNGLFACETAAEDRRDLLDDGGGLEGLYLLKWTNLPDEQGDRRQGRSA
jgi:hypothetical protein